MSKMSEYIAETCSEWRAPEVNDARILTMPNIPHALHGEGYQPRTIVGTTAWNYMRKSCYAKAGYCCEVCGCKPEKGKLHAHEVYNINYETGEQEFVRLVALCHTCHVLFIHSGRALTLYKQRSPLVPREHLLNGVEHGFKIINDYNKTHDEKIYPFNTFLDYFRTPDIEHEMNNLFKKYNMKVWKPVKGKYQCDWSDWHLLFNDKKYYTKYENQEDYTKKMEQKNKKYNTGYNLTGGIFSEIDDIIKENEKPLT